MLVFRCAVVGAGALAAEIAQVIAAAGIPVVRSDVERGLVQDGIERGAFGDVDFAIEAVPDRLELKAAVLSELDEVTPGHAILASTTAALSISELALASTRPDRVVGFRFAPPVSTMRLIEVVEGEETSPETMQAAMIFAQALRKTPIRCGDSPGFVVERILNAAVSELARVQEETGIAIEELDRIVAGELGVRTGRGLHERGR